MKTHKLLLFELRSKRMRLKLLLLAGFLLVLAVYDLLISPIFGDAWFLLWIGFVLAIITWIYYAILMRRSALHIYDTYMVLQGPLHKVKISYGRVHATTASKMDDHYAWESLKKRDRSWMKPLYQQTCGFMELYSLPSQIEKNKKKWFSKYLFSPRLTGLLLVVEDWMTLNQEIDAGVNRRRQEKGMTEKSDKRSLAAKILDY